MLSAGFSSSLLYQQVYTPSFFFPLAISWYSPSLQCWAADEGFQFLARYGWLGDAQEGPERARVQSVFSKLGIPDSQFRLGKTKVSIYIYIFPPSACTLFPFPRPLPISSLILGPVLLPLSRAHAVFSRSCFSRCPISVIPQVFFRSGVIALLEKLRAEKIHWATTVFQKHWRRIRVRRQYLLTIGRIRLLQAAARCFIQRQKAHSSFYSISFFLHLSRV